MQLLVLRLRYHLGWGQDPIILRVFAHMCYATAQLIVVYPPLFTLILVANDWSKHKHIIITPRTEPLLIFMYGSGALLLISVLLMGITFKRRYNAASRVPAEIFSGECYAVIPDAPLRLYARIGLTEAAATWYVMPIQWDRFVRPHGDTVTFEAYNSIGYVTQLLRVGLQKIGRTAQEEPAPTPAERMRRHNTPVAMRRYARKVSLQGWGVPSRAVFSTGLAGLTAFALFSIFPFVILLVPLLDPTVTYHDALLALLAVTPIIAMGCLSLVWSIVLFRVARRGKRGRNEPQEMIEGLVSLARMHWDTYCSHNHPSVYIEIAAGDGSSRIFRIPAELAHRVPERSRVRVECNPATEVVTDVTLLEAEEIAV